MPVIPMPVAAPSDSNQDSRSGHAVAARDRRPWNILEDNRRLAIENVRLAEENQALRAAAALWIRLYEKQLERANRVDAANAPRQPIRG